MRNGSFFLYKFTKKGGKISWHRNNETLLFYFIIFTVSLPLYSKAQTMTYKGLEYRKVDYGWKAININENITISTDRIGVKFYEKISENNIKRFIEDLGYKIRKKHLKSLYEISIPNYIDPFEAIVNFREFDIVEWTEVEGTMSSVMCSLPNDTYFSNQENLNDDLDRDIDAPEGWNIETGDSSVIVALIDHGVNINHSDLNDNIWNNSAEINGTTGVDDDSNGFIDDYYGWCFGDDYGAGSNNINWGTHGTKVAGIIAAETHNNTGVAGVAGGWNGNGIKLLISSPYDTSGNVWSYSDYYDAFVYAVDNGAKVINCSFAITSEITQLEEGVEYAIDNNVVVVAAQDAILPNGDSTPNFPAYYGNVISVGACYHNAKTPLSCFDDSLDVVAPSGQIPAEGYTPVYTTNAAGGYERGSSTSCAAPQVSGLAALLLSYNSSLTHREIYEIICKSTDKIGTSTYSDWANAPFGTWDDSLGYGRINVYKALIRARGYGNITTDITWHNDIELTDNVVINSGVTLTVDEDVTVSIANGKKIEVNGTLLVKDGVKFTKVSGGTNWSGIDIKSGTPGGVLDVDGDITIEYASLSLRVINWYRI